MTNKYLNDLLTPISVLGAMFLALQPNLILLRAHELERCLTSSNYEPGMCAATALALSVAQMLGASVFLTEAAGANDRWLRIFSGSGWIIATVLQLSLSVICATGEMGKLIALGLSVDLTLFETLAGYFAIDGFIVPAVLAIAWAISHRAKRSSSPRHPQQTRPHEESPQPATHPARTTGSPDPPR